MKLKTFFKPAGKQQLELIREAIEFLVGKEKAKTIPLTPSFFHEEPMYFAATENLAQVKKAGGLIAPHDKENEAKGFVDLNKFEDIGCWYGYKSMEKLLSHVNNESSHTNLYVVSPQNMIIDIPRFALLEYSIEDYKETPYELLVLGDIPLENLQAVIPYESLQDFLAGKTIINEISKYNLECAEKIQR